MKERKRGTKKRQSREREFCAMANSTRMYGRRGGTGRGRERMRKSEKRTREKERREEKEEERRERDDLSSRKMTCHIM